MKKPDLFYPQNISKMFLDTVNKYGKNEALIYKEGHHYGSLSYLELKDQVEKCASAFKKRGLEKKDRIVIISENRPEWVIVDLAATMLGAVVVPVHEVLSAEQIAGIFSEIKPEAVLLSSERTYEKVKDLRDKYNFYTVSFEDLGKKTIYFENFMKESDRCLLESEIEKIQPDDLASIIYTSGTSGGVKGVKLTHRNFVSNAVNVIKAVPCYPTDKFFSILPLSHVFERTAGYYIPIYGGSSIRYAVDLTRLTEEIMQAKPTIVIAVPRLFEKIFEKIHEKASESFIKKTMIYLGLRTKKGSFLYKIFDRLVFSKIRNQFGGQVRLFVSGGAPLPGHIADFFDQAGFVILEGYGLTECSPVVALNRVEDNCYGTVGKVIDDTEVKISDRSEILVRGVGVTSGYLKDDFTENSFTKDGFFKTGDLGTFDKEGHLKISGRIKDLIVLSTGKKVSPVHVEEILESSIFIDQAIVFGEGKKHISALIVPSFKKIAESFGKKSPGRMVKDEKILEFMTSEIEKTCAILATYERVEKFVLLPVQFTIEGGELTPSFKLRRGIILEKYKGFLDQIYR